jgi:hypothetical protein
MKDGYSNARLFLGLIAVAFGFGTLLGIPLIALAALG